MQVHQVIAVHGVFGEHLPIARDLVARRPGHDQLVDVVRPGVVGNFGEPVVEAFFGLGLGIDEDHATERAERRGEEADFGHVEIGEQRLVLGHAGELAFEIIGPMVIGAGQHRAAAAVALEQLVAAVPADVVERAQRTVAPAQHEQRITPDLNAAVVARRRRVGGHAGEAPGAAEQLGLLAVEPGLRRVGLGRQKLSCGGGLFEAACRGRHRRRFVHAIFSSTACTCGE